MSQPLPPYRPHQPCGVCSTCGVDHGAPPSQSAPRARSLHEVLLTALAIPFALSLCVVTPVVGFALARGVARSVLPLATFGPRAMHTRRNTQRFAPAYVRPATGYVPAYRRVTYASPCPFARPVEQQPNPQPVYAPAPGSMLAQAGPFSQNPWELLRRARALVAGGAPVYVFERTLDESSTRANVMLGPSERIVVQHAPDGTPILRLVYVPSGSAYGQLGMRSGDVLVAVNGRDPFSNNQGVPGGVTARHEPTVVEVLRGSRRLVFVTHTPDEPPAPREFASPAAGRFATTR